MPERDQCTWNSMISGFAQRNRCEEALRYLASMHKEGFSLNEYSLASGLSACSSLSDVNRGVQIHSLIAKSPPLLSDVHIGSALVDMYSKCGHVDEAQHCFDELCGYRNVVTWNSLITCYEQNGPVEEALSVFNLMLRSGFEPDEVTLASVISACASLSALKVGREVHGRVAKDVKLRNDIILSNAFVDMYAKCGCVEDGYLVFRKMVERDRVSWNAMIIGFAQNGYGNEALELFREMLGGSGEKPDHITMIGVLSACGHAGLVDEGRRYFSSMARDFGVAPLRDHYTCMVDLLGRAGFLEEAKSMIEEEMPMEPDSVIWGSLLGACKVHRNITLGKYVAEKLLEVETSSNSGPYVLLSNMYAENGQWEDVMNVRKSMRREGVTKQPGFSWIEIQGRSHVFMVKDKRHPRKKQIHSLLDVLIAEMRQEHAETGPLSSEEMDYSSSILWETAM
ncbi:hypothetical protein DY000_02005187 [Brassica cretica]|uniref:DYW domain-containing protein n=1 Tax=Brassica cretica TaxID=69181 RepID=A0ABQ7C217_BRACR|nr:hypothetical protein DY000_02005187 [Brassica cretica]